MCASTFLLFEHVKRHPQQLVNAVKRGTTVTGDWGVSTGRGQARSQIQLPECYRRREIV